MAERVGFEPTVGFPRHSLSRRAPSTARTPLRNCCFILAERRRLGNDGSVRRLLELRDARRLPIFVRAQKDWQKSRHPPPIGFVVCAEASLQFFFFQTDY